MKHVIMINCGGVIDVVETLQPEDCVKFYICDRLVIYCLKSVYCTLFSLLLINYVSIFLTYVSCTLENYSHFV